MKTNQKLILAAMMAAMMQPLVFKAQTNVRFRDPLPNAVATPGKKIEWKPVKLNDAGSNVQNGVEFYSQTRGCPTIGKVTLAKLVNTNSYAVKVSYQVSPESPVENIIVPPSLTVEGSCVMMNGDFSKLVIKLPDNEEAAKQSKQHLLSHLVVSKNQ